MFIRVALMFFLNSLNSNAKFPTSSSTKCSTLLGSMDLTWHFLRVLFRDPIAEFNSLPPWVLMTVVTATLPLLFLELFITLFILSGQSLKSKMSLIGAFMENSRGEESGDVSSCPHVSTHIN